MKEYNFLEKV